MTLSGASIYWQADLDALYRGWGGWLYPPVLAQILAISHIVPWAVFVTGWMALVFVSAWYVLRWATVPLFALGAIGYALYLTDLTMFLGWALLGNAQYVMLAAIVLGIRNSAGWPFAILTKLAPVIGLLALPTRQAARAVALTGAVCALSFAIAPHLWWQWAAWMLGPHDAPIVPVVGWLPVRVGAAIGLALYARAGHQWVVPLACGLALPVLYEGAIVPFAAASAILWRRAA